MKEPVFIVWTVLTLVSGFLFLWSLKAYKRKPGKYLSVYKFILLLVTMGISLLVYHFLGTSPHLIWESRLAILSLGIINTWIFYNQDWIKDSRDKFHYNKDSFFPELMLFSFQAFLVSVGFVLAPQIFGLVAYKVDVSWPIWDIPLCFILPFFIVKLSDLSSQIPYRIVENPWVFPIEPITTENWPWRDLMQINFQVKKSLLDEYHLFSWPTRPWIEAPKEISLGNVFRLVIQERRRRSGLATIQDMGDEYGGTPGFWWLFSVKIVWWNPVTWFRNPRFLNPELSITENKIRKNDIILIRRIPGDGSITPGVKYKGSLGTDPDKTIIIHR